jgi:uncharacterized protein (TIGR03083 family)
MIKNPCSPLDLRYLFPEMRQELLRVLNSLSDEQWQAPTACEGWSVKDVALHIFADDCGFLSRHRDNDGITFVTNSWDELIGLINQQNEGWVKATRRISRRLLLQFLQITGDELSAYLDTIELGAKAGNVSWAGKQASGLWMQIAREYTEYWMHHQHVCEGAGIKSLKSRRYLHPALSTFVYALPRTYQDVAAPENTLVRFEVRGEVADCWDIIKEADGWTLYASSNLSPAATVSMDEDTAWRMFTKGISANDLHEQTQISGEQALGEALLRTVAILA